MMVLVVWNKISSASSYLEDVRYSVDEGLVREFGVSDPLILFRSWHLVCLSEDAVG